MSNLYFRLRIIEKSNEKCRKKHQFSQQNGFRCAQWSVQRSIFGFFHATLTTLLVGHIINPLKGSFFHPIAKLLFTHFEQSVIFFLLPVSWQQIDYYQQMDFSLHIITDFSILTDFHLKLEANHSQNCGLPLFSRLTATLNLCWIYFKILVHVF